jgi:hypothetical protein
MNGLPGYYGDKQWSPTAAMEVLLSLTASDLLIMAEMRMALYRLYIIKRPTAFEAEAELLSVWKDVSDPILIYGRTTLFLFTTIPESLRSL